MGKIWKVALSAEKLELLLRYYSHPLVDTPKFRISKSQKKVLKRMQEALAGNLHGCDFENVDSRSDACDDVHGNDNVDNNGHSGTNPSK
jgi:hypothetical protein